MPQVAVAFVDMAGFTALTAAHGDVDAADLAGRFCGHARGALGPSSVLVKTLGDAVMLVDPHPGELLRTVLGVFASAARDDAFPMLRAGLAEGEAVERDGDWFGGTVNTAARLAARAAGQQLLLTGPALARAARETLPVAELGEITLRGLPDPVATLAVDLGTPKSAVDPVCRMRVAAGQEAARVRYADADWALCSLGCAALFTAAPERYA